jgi:hypothetical protein
MIVTDRALRRRRALATPAAVLLPCWALALDPAAAPVLPPSTDDRIVLSLDGATLTGTDGGEGGSAGWLHNFDADTLAGIAVEGQKLANTNWTFGSINGSKTLGAGETRYSIYGEAHEGVVHDESTFGYHAEAIGVVGSYFHRLALTVEDREFDILRTRGNLPKLGIGYQWNPHVATSASYAYSIGGNLGTRLSVLRVDYTQPTVNYLAGVAFGTASPAVLNIPGFVATGSSLREAYVGMSKPFPSLRSDLSVVLDYIDLKKTTGTEQGPGAVLVEAFDSKKFTLTVSYIFHFGHGAAP